MILITDMSVFSSKGGRGGLNLKKSFKAKQVQCMQSSATRSCVRVSHTVSGRHARCVHVRAAARGRIGQRVEWGATPTVAEHWVGVLLLKSRLATRGYRISRVKEQSRNYEKRRL